LLFPVLVLKKKRMNKEKEQNVEKAEELKDDGKYEEKYENGNVEDKIKASSGIIDFDNKRNGTKCVLFNLLFLRYIQHKSKNKCFSSSII